MIGQNVNIRDIELDLESLVLPNNLLSNESLSPDTEGEEQEVEQEPFSIVTSCRSCGAGVRICVFATRFAISTLQQLLILELSLLCPTCSRIHCRHGRT
uniref:Protein E7 n=1 Tax=Human papillomavirus TaxID=10566 RepID=A0A385PJJ4_9PAPI|nr:MAG: E7 protein [Human papillomavirus]